MESGRAGALQQHAERVVLSCRIGQRMHKADKNNLRVAFFNYSDLASGAEALVDQTITALIARGIEARLIVMDRFTDKPYVYTLPHFFGERRLEYNLRRATGRNNLFFPSTLFLGFN